jgi:hypothetical protein
LKTWKADKAWADRYWPQIVGVVREVAGDIITVREATPDEDTRYATDYVLTLESGDIACRVRRWDYWQRFGDITLRNSRPSGAMTEIEKLRQGWGRWYLYAWAKAEGDFGAWVFVDLDALRSSGLLDRSRGDHQNLDGSSSFVSLPLSELRQHDCLIRAGGAAQHYAPEIRDA